MQLPYSVPPPTLQESRKKWMPPPPKPPDQEQVVICCRKITSPTPTKHSQWATELIIRWETWCFHHFNFSFCFLYLQFFVFFSHFSFGVWKFLLYFSETGVSLFLIYLWKASCPLFWWQGKPPSTCSHPTQWFSPYHHKIYSSFVPLDFEDSSLFWGIC